MNIDNIQKLLHHILVWQSGHPKLVIGLEGYSGAGKTTLIKQIAQLTPIAVVHMDQFQVSDDKRKELERISPVEAVIEKYRFDKLVDLVRRFREGERSVQYELHDPDTGRVIQETFMLDIPVLIVDGIWLSNHDRLPSVFDRIVFLDVDSDLGDLRRRQREGQLWAADAWEETHPDSYVVQYKIAHDRYMEKYTPKQTADLVLKII